MKIKHLYTLVVVITLCSCKTTSHVSQPEYAVVDVADEMPAIPQYSTPMRNNNTGPSFVYDLKVSTMTRELDAKLYIKNGSGNTFSGTMVIDGDVRQVAGWYTEEKSEGGIYIYNTKSISFYVMLNNSDFMHQQLFRAKFNRDNTLLGGTYFYFGNEFIFSGKLGERR